MTVWNFMTIDLILNLSCHSNCQSEYYSTLQYLIYLLHHEFHASNINSILITFWQRSIAWNFPPNNNENVIFYKKVTFDVKDRLWCI